MQTSVNKFGQFSIANTKLPKGPQGIGFSQTKDGDYHMKNKKLKFTGDPENDLDAANKKYVDLKCKTAHVRILPQTNEEVFTVNERRVVKLKPPMSGRDATTKNYVDEEIETLKAEVDDNFVKMERSIKNYIDTKVGLLKIDVETSLARLERDLHLAKK